MREIVLDTETTGLDPSTGHKVVEIGCVELINHMPTDNNYHQYINPERDMPEEAFAVHGLSEEFLSDHPVFAEIAQSFIDYIGDAPLIIHNASFDMGFLNAELTALHYEPLKKERAVDTVPMARRKFPGARVNLDALCQRFEIDNTNRTLHGALLDARLLSDVYLELIGGRQPGLELKKEEKAAGATEQERAYREPRPHAASPEELATHQEFLKQVKEPLWDK
ncbi:MAG: DNA polymerase III subunit epsilon [Rhodospirillales bacterium]|nr:DNA polymerase III subunit epsilon [Rhodospirillales bacterium]